MLVVLAEHPEARDDALPAFEVAVHHLGRELAALDTGEQLLELVLLLLAVRDLPEAHLARGDVDVAREHPDRVDLAVVAETRAELREDPSAVQDADAGPDI